jgi:hypothetical protein
MLDHPSFQSGDAARGKALLQMALGGAAAIRVSPFVFNHLRPRPSLLKNYYELNGFLLNDLELRVDDLKRAISR